MGQDWMTEAYADKVEALEAEIERLRALTDAAAELFVRIGAELPFLARNLEVKQWQARHQEARQQ